MRMMKNNRNETIMVIGIDHGYGNMKTATRCFPSGVARYDEEPIFQNNLLVYNGMYYQIGEEHKEFCAEKTQDLFPRFQSPDFPCRPDGRSAGSFSPEIHLHFPHKVKETVEPDDRSAQYICS